MTIKQLDIWADDAAARYEQLCLNWSAIYRNTLMAPNFGAASLLQRATTEANAVAERYLVREQPYIAEAINAASNEAHTALRADLQVDAQSERRTQLETHLTSCQRYLIEELHAQVTRDVALLRKSIQAAVFAVNLVVRAGNITPRAAVVEYQVGETKPLGFVFRDKLGRQINAATFVRSIWRQTVQSVTSETTLWDLIGAGFTTAGIFKQIDGVIEQIATISLTGARDLPAYSDIRAQLFHPNSTAFIGRDIDYVSS